LVEGGFGQRHNGITGGGGWESQTGGSRNLADLLLCERWGKTPSSPFYRHWRCERSEHLPALTGEEAHSVRPAPLESGLDGVSSHRGPQIFRARSASLMPAFDT
jgi:hypothetical protein